MQSPKAQMYRRSFLLGTLLPLVLIMTPIGIHLWYLRAYAISLPVWDEWEFWWSMKGFDVGNWHHAFWIPHNEHRLVVTRVFYFLLRYTTALDVTIAMYFNVLLVCLTLLGLWLHLRASVKVSLWYLVPVAFVLFSLEQWENILWGWQIAIYSMVCSSVWSLYFLSRPGMGSLGAAILTACISSLSFVNGLMIWPVGVVYLFLAGKGRKWLLIWSGSAAVMLFVYFRNYVTQVTRPSPTALVRPTSLAEFFEAPLSLLGDNPFSLPTMIFGNIGALLAPQHLAMAVIIGVLIVLIFVISVSMMSSMRAIWERLPLSLITIALLSFFSSLTIIAGRMGYWDTEFVLSSRYTTITVLGIIAVYLVTVAIANVPSPQLQHFRRVGGVMCGALCLIFLLGLPAGYDLGLNKGQELATERLWQLEVIREYETRSDEELSRVYPKTLRDRLLYWQSHKLVPFNN